MNEWFFLVLLSTATYRLTRLVVTDDFPPILWMRDRLVGGWRALTEAEEARVSDQPVAWSVQVIDNELCRKVERASWVPAWLASLLSCSWCASGWIALGLVGVSDVWLSVPAPGLMWLGAWGLGALLAAQEWA